MRSTQKSGGTSLYFYTPEAIKKNKVDYLKAETKPLTRKQRRLIEKELKRRGY